MENHRIHQIGRPTAEELFDALDAHPCVEILDAEQLEDKNLQEFGEICGQGGFQNFASLKVRECNHIQGSFQYPFEALDFSVTMLIENGHKVIVIERNNLDPHVIDLDDNDA